ncbi:hypothetical protein FA13DRAFT_274492 [Coprinellus micaceus]|uniref:Uncharacterized protein n=1 Tax=Coprinellus micaceus TaxID=71717 RepID=A0A4Y7SG22_COPMI|nr:hypothetical protein FA13DRAFT_274492 [Coprinellus micaceus]
MGMRRAEGWAGTGSSMSIIDERTKYIRFSWYIHPAGVLSLSAQLLHFSGFVARPSVANVAHRPHKSCKLAARLKLRPKTNAIESNQGETFIFRPQSDIERGTRRDTGIVASEVKARKSETGPCHEVPATPVGMPRRFSLQFQRALNPTLGPLHL